jgi:hypothetical protein
MELGVEVAGILGVIQERLQGKMGGVNHIEMGKKEWIPGS